MGRLRRVAVGLLTLLAASSVAVPSVVAESGVSEQIVGGSTVTISEAPWQVAVLDPTTSGGYLAQYCGGTIISAQWVLTAAHCVRDDADRPLSPSQVQIGSGSASLSDFPSAVRTGVAQIIEHPSYEAGTYLNDIALLRLSSALDLSGPNRSAIALPFSVDATSWPALGAGVSASGWGCTDVLGFDDSCSSYTETLRRVSMSVRADPTDWRCAGLTGYWAPLMLCAGSASGGADTCAGDSGGPPGGRGRLLRDSRWSHQLGGGLRPERLPRGLHTGDRLHRLDIRSHRDYCCTVHPSGHGCPGGRGLQSSRSDSVV